MIVWAILFLILLVFLSKRVEGLAQDELALAIQSIEAALKDPRMTPSQKMALQDALYYARDIRHLYPKPMDIPR